MTHLLLIVSLAWGGEFWSETSQKDNCTVFVGERAGRDYAPVRAECHWADVQPDKLRSLLTEFANHDRYFASVSSAEHLGGDRYRQVHAVSGMSDREVILNMTIADIEGGKRFAWTKASDQSGLSGDQVETIANTGMWEVTASPSGGTNAVYEVYYDPGGRVPAFMVRWFQGSGTYEVLNDLRSYASSH